MGKTLGYGEITVANMTEPFTVMLTNEAQQFATDSNRKVTSAQSYYTDIIVIRGSQERTDYTIGNITSGSGITVSKSSKRVTFSVSAGTTIGADTGVIEIPITLDGQTVKKQFSWSCGKQGPQGVQGNDGNSFAWNMLSETNCGKKHWGTESSGGKYSVEDFITEDNIDAVKLICTEAISTSNWSYVSFKDIKMLKQLKPSTKYTLSYDIKANRSGAISHSICKGDVSNFCTNTVVVNNIIGNETWQHISVVLTTNDLKTTPTNEILYLGRNALSNVGYSIIKNLKLVEGDIDTPWSPSQSDIEGKGVVETVQYYLATSQASGVTSSTSGWSTDITTQKLTADKKYLWNCYQTKYSDGTSEPISTPKVIGVYGDKGETGVSTKILTTSYSYNQSDIDKYSKPGYSGTWGVGISTNGLKVGDNVLLRAKNTSKNSDCLIFAQITKIVSEYQVTCTSYGVIDNGADAKNLTITPSSQYFKSTDGGKTFAPDTITIKPTIQGEINFGKWQYSIDGGVSFADAVSGQKGLMISNNVLTVRKDSSLYSDAVTMVTFRAVANDSGFYDTCSIAKLYDVSDIGDGRNLLTGVSSYTKDTPFEKTDSRADGWTMYQNIITSIELEAGKKYVLQAKTDGNWAANHDINGQDPSKKLVTLWLCSDKTNNCFDMRQGYAVFTPTVTAKYKLRVNQYSNGTDAYTIHLWDIKLEKGSSPTGWTPAPEDLQTAILSTKSEISDVSLKVDKNKQAIEQRVEKTTYQQDLNLVKGDISKANEGLNKWRYEIYPKSLFASEYQGKSTMDVFAKNTNLTPSQSMLINDTDFGKSWAYGDNYIGYALTFVKFSAAKSVAITFKHDDGAHLYLNGKLIGGDDTCNTGSGESLTLSFIQGWNCLEVVLNEKSGGEYIGLGTTISALSECQLMNCYYGTPVARQSHITNQLVENTTNIKGISTKVSKVTSVIGDNGENFTSFKNDYSDFKQTMNGFKTTVGQTYVTKDDFNGLEIGGRNLLLYSQTIRAHNNYYGVSYLIDEVETFNGCPVWSVKNQWGRLAWSFKSHVIDRGLVKVGDTLTYSLYAKTNNASGKSISCSYRFKGNAQTYWFKGSAFNIGTSWARYSATFTVTKDMLATDTYMNEIGFEETASMSGDDKVYYTCPKLERGTKATDYTPAPEDVNGKIVNVETIANQTAKKFEWIVKGGDSSSNFTLTDRVADLVAERINFKGLVTFSGLNTDAKNEIGKVAQSKVDGLEVGGRNLLVQKNITEGYLSTDGKGSFVGSGGGDQTSDWIDVSGNKYITITLYEDFTNTNNSGRYCEYDADKNCINTVVYNPRQKSSIIIELKSNTKYIRVTAIECKTRRYKIEAGNKATDWTPAPEDVSQDATNKASQALTDAKNYSSSAVNWVTNNGSSTTNLNSMVKKWTDGAVSNTTQINGGWIKANTITASKIALADFTNYSQLTRDTAATYGFAVTDDTDGTWFSTQGIRRDQFISETFPCNGGESYLIEYDISTNAKGANNSTDTKNYIGVAIGVYGYTGTVGSNGLPNKATNIWYATRVTGSETAAVTHVKTTITTSTATKQFRIFLQSNGYYFEGTTKIRNLSVRRMYGGTLIVDGSITADKIATDAIKSRNYISSGGTQGSFLNLSDGSFTSPNLSWDANGNLIAKNANIIGNLTAGTVGEWKIDKYIYSRDKMFFDINKHNGQSIYNKNSTNNLFLGDGKVSSFYWFTTQNNTFIIENGNSPQYATGPAGISFGTNIAQGQIELYESVYPGNIIQDYEQTSHTSELSISGSKISFSYYDSNGSSFSDSPYTYIMADYARFYGDIFVQGSITTDEGVDVGGKLQASSIATKNGGLIETAGTVYGGGEIQCGGGQMRIIGGNYGILLRNDGSDFYILSTDSGSPWGSWNSKRPFRINLANGIPYFEYGIIIPNENYLLGNGYQLARGTSWGGVCIGDDSKGLRLYGTSIWASHSISTSDENLKENFTTLDQYEDFYMNLNPIGFNYIGDYDGKKTHFGFGAHKTEDILESEGYDSDKFAVVTHRPLVQEDIEKRFGKDVEVDIETEYGISYTEFIALNTHMIQKTRRELTKVKQEKADIEARLQAIEAKLGL